MCLILQCLSRFAFRLPLNIKTLRNLRCLLAAFFAFFPASSSRPPPSGPFTPRLLSFLRVSLFCIVFKVRSALSFKAPFGTSRERAWIEYQTFLPLSTPFFRNFIETFVLFSSQFVHLFPFSPKNQEKGSKKAPVFTRAFFLHSPILVSARIFHCPFSLNRFTRYCASGQPGG